MTSQISTAIITSGVVLMLSLAISMLVAGMVKILYLVTKHSVGKKKP